MPQFSHQDLADWSGGRWSRPPAAPPAGVSQDTRTLRPGELYVAIRGERYDGHRFLDAADSAGGVAALVDEAFVGAAAGHDLPLLVVRDTRTALTALAAGYRSRLRLTRIGISGSVGKTTVKELAADMLERAGPTIRNPGNWNNDIGLPLSLLRIEPSHRYGVFELGINHPGEMAGLRDCLAPDAAVLTRVGPVHIGFFDDEAAIAREKAVLFTALPAGAPAVVSRDNPWFDEIRRLAGGPVVTTGLDPDAAYRGRPLEGQEFEVTESASGETRRFAAPLPGAYFLEDALLAIALCRRLGLAWDDVADAVAGYTPPPMRWNLHHIGDRTVIDDSYNANPVSMHAAMEAFARVPARRRWLVLGAMLELGGQAVALHRKVGTDAAAGPWGGLIAFGPWGAHIAAGARAAGLSPSQIFACSTHDDVVDCLDQYTEPGDAVLIKASRGEQLDRIPETWQCRLHPHQAGV